MACKRCSISDFMLATCFLKCSKTCVTTLQYLLQRREFHLTSQASAPRSTSVFSSRRSHYRDASHVCRRFPRALIIRFSSAFVKHTLGAVSRHFHTLYSTF